jgi:hypothetical protein
MAENIAYGPPSARDVVRELIIDQGVASRGHRRNIFNATVDTAGVKCGAHKVYGAMCVIDFARDPQKSVGWRQTALTPPARGGSWLFRLMAWR